MEREDLAVYMSITEWGEQHEFREMGLLGVLVRGKKKWWWW